MKKILALSLVALATNQWNPAFLRAAEAKKAESQSIQNNSKVSTTSILANALLLAEIYRKIQRIANQEDKAQLTPLLNQLNTSLDQVLAFKESFTPIKRQRVETQLLSLKGQIQAMAVSQSKEFKNSSLQLASSLLDLVDILLDKSKPESVPSTM